MAMIDEEFLRSGLAASGMVFGCQRYDGPVVPLHYMKKKKALDKKRQQASKQLQAQLLHHDRTNAKRRDDCLMGNAAEALQLKSDSNQKKKRQRAMAHMRTSLDATSGL